MGKRIKIKMQRGNTIRISTIFRRFRCAGCNKKVFWFNICNALSGSKKRRIQFADAKVCNKCCKKAGVKHYRQIGVFKVYKSWKYTV